MARPKGSGPTKGSWKKGFCPNPGGKPKEYKEVKEAYQALSWVALAAHRSALKNTQTKVQAANAINERAWGKPSQEILIGGNGGLPVVTEHTVYIATGVNRKGTTPDADDKSGE